MRSHGYCRRQLWVLRLWGCRLIFYLSSLATLSTFRSLFVTKLKCLEFIYTCSSMLRLSAKKYKRGLYENFSNAPYMFIKRNRSNASFNARQEEALAPLKPLMNKRNKKANNKNGHWLNTDQRTETYPHARWLLVNSVVLGSVRIRFSITYGRYLT